MWAQKLGRWMAPTKAAERVLRKAARRDRWLAAGRD